MIDLRPIFALTLLAASVALVPPSPGAARELASWALRPATLPFAWQAMRAAMRDGDAREVFARGQRILQLLPTWTDGHAAFAYRFALTRESVAADPAVAAVAAERRLHLALAWLDRARADAGKRELEVLQMQAFLPEVACNQFPGLADRLAPAGGAAGITAAYLAEAERRFPSPAVREQRIFHTPKLAAALLATGDAAQALAVLDTAIARAATVRDRELATEWQARLVEVGRFLRGDRTVDLTAVRADPRLAPLWPYLR